MWAVVSAAAIAIMLIAIGLPLLGWLPWVSPARMVGLTLFAWLSIIWAAWPQNALVEGDRSLFYACVLVVCLLALGRVDGRRVAAGLVVAGAGGDRRDRGVGAVADGRRHRLLFRPPRRRHRLRRRHGGAGRDRGLAGDGLRLRPGDADRRCAPARASPPAPRRRWSSPRDPGPRWWRWSSPAWCSRRSARRRCAAPRSRYPVLVVIGFRWSDLNSAFTVAAGETQVRAAGAAVMTAAVVGGARRARPVADRPAGDARRPARRLVTGGAAALVATVVVLGLVAFARPPTASPAAGSMPSGSSSRCRTARTAAGRTAGSARSAPAATTCGGSRCACSATTRSTGSARGTSCTTTPGRPVGGPAVPCAQPGAGGRVDARPRRTARPGARAGPADRGGGAPAVPRERRRRSACWRRGWPAGWPTSCCTPPSTGSGSSPPASCRR